jgi:uncharacterized membrane protein YedE/YeeE
MRLVSGSKVSHGPPLFLIDRRFVSADGNNVATVRSGAPGVTRRRDEKSGYAGWHARCGRSCWSRNTMNPLLLSAPGGILIGLSAAMLLLMNGKIAGISGIVGGLFGPPAAGDGAWRVAFVAGLVTAGAIATVAAPALIGSPAVRSPAALVVAGLLVGLGTRIGNGCTSGHGVCGLGRLSRRSLAATATFMASGALTVLVSRHLVGDGP